MEYRSPEWYEMRDWIISTMPRKKPREDVLHFLSTLRSAHPDMEWLLGSGQCYNCFRIIQSIWPDAVPWYDGNHVWTELDGWYFDIRGAHESIPADSYRLDQNPGGDPPENWGKRDTRRLCHVLGKVGPDGAYKPYHSLEKRKQIRVGRFN